MSRRYGRNQKRKHREEIARLRVELDRLVTMAETLAAKLQAQERHVQEIAESINKIVRYSALLPPAVGPLADREDINPLMVRTARRTRLAPISDELETVAVDILELELWQLEVTLEKKLTTFERIVHMLVPGPAGLTYRISEPAYRQFLHGRLPEVVKVVYQQFLSALQPSKVDNPFLLR